MDDGRDRLDRLVDNPRVYARIADILQVCQPVKNSWDKEKFPYLMSAPYFLAFWLSKYLDFKRCHGVCQHISL